MAESKPVDQIARAAVRLKALADKYRAALNAGDEKLIQELQAEIARLQEAQDKLRASIPSKPPGTMGRPVR